MTRLRAAVISIAALVFVVFVGTQALLPPFFQSRLEEGLVQSLPGTREVDVRVRAFPAWRLLQGRADRVVVELRDTRLSGVPVDRFHLSGRGVQIDLGLLLRGGGVELRGAEEIDARLELSEASINRYLREEIDPVGFFEAKVEEGVMKLDGGVRLLGRPVQIQIEGDFRVTDGTWVEFAPRRVAVDETVVPGFILETLAASQDLRVGFDVGSFPIPLVVRDVRLEPGLVVVLAGLEHAGPEQSGGAATSVSAPAGVKELGGTGSQAGGSGRR